MKKWYDYRKFKFPSESEWEITDVSCGYNAGVFHERYEVT